MNGIDAAAVIFDFDGVIVDSAQAVEKQWREFASHFKLDERALISGVHGRRDRDVIAGWLPSADIEEAAEWMRSTAFDHRDLPLLPGAAAALSAASKRPWAIATSAAAGDVAGRLMAEGLSVPQVLVSGVDVSRGKPDPECYLLATAGLAVEPSECVVFEDAPSGVEAARAAGIGHVVATATTHDPMALTEADVIVTDLSGIHWGAWESASRIAW